MNELWSVDAIIHGAIRCVLEKKGAKEYGKSW